MELALAQTLTLTIEQRHKVAQLADLNDAYPDRDVLPIGHRIALEALSKEVSGFDFDPSPARA